MSSKAFIFFTVLFIVGLAIVGWYCLDRYYFIDPFGMPKGSEYLSGGNVVVAEDRQSCANEKIARDFPSWIRDKSLRIYNYIEGQVKVFFK